MVDQIEHVATDEACCVLAADGEREDHRVSPPARQNDSRGVSNAFEQLTAILIRQAHAELGESCSPDLRRS